MIKYLTIFLLSNMSNASGMMPGTTESIVSIQITPEGTSEPLGISNPQQALPLTQYEEEGRAQVNVLNTINNNENYNQNNNVAIDTSTFLRVVNYLTNRSNRPFLLLTISTLLSWYVLYLVVDGRIEHSEYCSTPATEEYLQFCDDSRADIENFTLFAVAASSAVSTFLLFKNIFGLHIQFFREHLTGETYIKIENSVILLASITALTAIIANAATVIPFRFEDFNNEPPEEVKLIDDAKTRELQVVFIAGIRSIPTLYFAIKKLIALRRGQHL